MAEYLSEDAEQVNCEMHQLNNAMKYGFGILENTRSTISVDENGLQIKLSSLKWKHVSKIITPGGVFPQGKELIHKLISIATYFDHPQRFQRLKNVQEYNNVPVGFPSRPITTSVSSVHKLMTQSIFFYWSHKWLYDETKYYKDDEGFLKAFKYIKEEEWETILEVEDLSVSVAKYSMSESQMSRIMSPWIQYMRKKVCEILNK